MLTLRRHTAADYADLPDIDRTSVGDLTEADARCLQEVGAYLVQAGVHERFGISLLHSHFPVADGELLVEDFDPVQRTVSLHPREGGGFSDDELIPLNLRFDRRPADATTLVGLEYGLRSRCGGLAAVGDADAQTLAGLRDLLARHAAVDRFGVRLIHDPLNIDDDKVLLESCERDARRLRCEVTSRGDRRFLTSVETFWSWEPVCDAAGGAVLQACQRNCLKGCISGGVIGTGHHPGPHDVLHDREP